MKGDAVGPVKVGPPSVQPCTPPWVRIIRPLASCCGHVFPESRTRPTPEGRGGKLTFSCRRSFRTMQSPNVSTCPSSSTRILSRPVHLSSAYISFFHSVSFFTHFFLIIFSFFHFFFLLFYFLLSFFSFFFFLFF